MSLTFNLVPFGRALALMVNGRADTMLGPNRNSEREAYIFYMAEELPREKIFFLHKYTTKIIEYRDLSELSIGVLSRAIYFDNFDKDDKLKKIIVNRYSNAIKMVQACRTNIVITPVHQGEY